MSIAQRTASERFIKAMGSMIEDENKMSKVILFIQTLNYEEDLPQMTYQELESCIPLETAFSKIRENIKDAYAVKA